MKKDDDIERIKAYMEAKMKHIKMYNECMNLADGLDVEKFAELVRADERQAIWDILINYASRDDLSDDDESLLLHLGRLIQARCENGLR
jgi:hypothetical protein